VERGTEQLTALPVQPVYVEYVTLSLCRINTLYPVIAEPPSAGAVQVIKTLPPETVVVGVDGVEGTVAGIVAPLPAGDEADLPKAFMA
jgi:hypothetical protein